jgi:ribonuclease HI
MKDSKTIKIYTDGGCDKNPGGTGGWAYRVIDEDKIIDKSGRVENTTNNRMELTAAIKALESIKKPAQVELFTDSQYLSRGMTEWIFGWIKRNWILKDGSPVKNADLWQTLYELGCQHKVKWTWVRGHGDDPHNLQVDRMVKQAMKGKVASGRAASMVDGAAIPVVKINRSKGKPVGVTLFLKASKSIQMDSPVELKVGKEQLQKLVEDLIAALREIEES